MTKRWLLVALVLSGVASCNVMPHSAKHPGECGIALVMWLRTPATSQYEYFTIDEGEFRYGAGIDALNFRTSWGRALSPAECAEIKQMAESAGWLVPQEATPEIASNAPRADLSLALTDDDVDQVLPGDDPAVARLAVFLRGIADFRFNRYLDKLPEAGKLK